MPGRDIARAPRTGGGGGGESNEIMGIQESIEQRVHVYAKFWRSRGFRATGTPSPPLHTCPVHNMYTCIAAHTAGLKYYKPRREPYSYLNLMLAVCPSTMKCPWYVRNYHMTYHTRVLHDTTLGPVA